MIRDVWMVAHRHPAQHRGRLALAAGRQHHKLAGRDVVALAQVDQRAFGRTEVADLGRDLQVLIHAAAGHGHLAPEPVGDVDHLPQPGQVRGEGRDDDPAGRLADQLLEVLADHRLGAGPAAILDADAVREQRQHALVAKAPQRVLVRAAPVDRLPIELVVAGMEDRSDRRLDGEADRARHAVVDIDRFDGERVEIDDVARLELDQLDPVESADALSAWC